jgi:hypothetical protein
VEVFLAEGAAGSYGQGRVFLGAAAADATGAFAVPVSGANHGEAVTATATDGEGSTSEFASNLMVVDVRYAGGEGAIAAADFKFSVGTTEAGGFEGWLIHAPRSGGHVLSTAINSIEVQAGVAGVWGLAQDMATGWTGPFNMVVTEHSYRFTTYDAVTGAVSLNHEGALIGGSLRVVGPL